MAKYSKEIVNKCADWVRVNGLMEYGGAKLKDFLSYFSIDQRTYYRWMQETEFAEAIKKAKTDFRNSLETDIVRSLANAAKGYEYTQTMMEYKGDVMVKKTVKNVRVEPNVGAAIFLLTNLAPERWQNKQRKELAGDVSGLTVVVDKMEDTELVKNIKEL